MRPLLGDAAEPVRAEEGGLGFTVDLLGGQKTGWFFDQRENRDRVARLAAGATVLDAFCHTGGFGLRCAAAGRVPRRAARPQRAMRSTSRRGPPRRTGWRRASETPARGGAGGVGAHGHAGGERFDIVVADPPAFAKSRARTSRRRCKGYAKLARLAAALVAPGGFLFLASCSHHVAPGDFADAAVWGIGRARREARILFQGGAGPDHPVHPMLPESAYLKAMLFQLA